MRMMHKVLNVLEILMKKGTHKLKKLEIMRKLKKYIDKPPKTVLTKR